MVLVLRKFMSLMMLTTLFINTSFANVSMNDKLEDSFNKYVYEMSQVSDNDKAGKEKVKKSFQNEIVGLIKQGLTKKDLLVFTKKNINDQNLGKDLNKIITHGEVNNLPEDEILKLVAEGLKKGSATGSNYSGDLLTWGLGAALLALFIYAIINCSKPDVDCCYNDPDTAYNECYGGYDYPPYYDDYYYY